MKKNRVDNYMSIVKKKMKKKKRKRKRLQSIAYLKGHCTINSFVYAKRFLCQVYNFILLFFIKFKL
jgi:hypothetical protein